MYLPNWQKTSFSRLPRPRRRWHGICHKGLGGPENDTQSLETDKNTQSYKNAGTLGSNCRPSRRVLPRTPPKRSKKARGGLESDRPGSIRLSNDGGWATKRRRSRREAKFKAVPPVVPAQKGKSDGRGPRFRGPCSHVTLSSGERSWVSHTVVKIRQVLCCGAKP